MSAPNERTGQVFHIDAGRYKRIRAQGWKLGRVSAETRRLSDHHLDPTVNVYHLVDGDVAECPECAIVIHGLIAETPAELETAKEQVRLPVLRDKVIKSAITWRGCRETDSARFLAQLTVDVDNWLAAQKPTPDGQAFRKRQELFIKAANHDPPIMSGDGAWRGGNE